LPSSLTWSHPVSDAQLEALQAANNVFRLERTRRGALRVNPPTELATSDANAEIIYQLRAWWKTHRKGLVADSNAGFYLSDGSMLSPDAAYLTEKTVAGFSTGNARGIPHLCPDFVIELLSRSDRLQETQQKMDDWLANGVQLGWLLDPYRQRVLVYEPGGSPVTADGPYRGPIEGFVLDLTEVWQCYR
jgi:Uma2 family endonuclease